MKLFGKTFQVFFAPPDAGTLVNATDTYVNAYTGDKTAFSAPNDLSSTMKTYYDTELLENARPNLILAQFARKQPLPMGRGKSVEWRKWNTLADAPALQEGVIPTGQKFGQSSMTQTSAPDFSANAISLSPMVSLIMNGTPNSSASRWKSLSVRFDSRGDFLVMTALMRPCLPRCR